MRLILLGLAITASACGDGSSGFEACGGDAIGNWSFTGATVENACSSGNPPIAGNLTLNPNGHYAVNGQVKAWQLHQDQACGFDTAHAGFWKASGTRICFADDPTELDSKPCDESTHTLERPWSAAADYCVAGGTLTLSTASFFGLNQKATLTLTK